MPPKFFRCFRRRGSPEQIQSRTTSSESPSNDTDSSRPPAVLLSQNNTASPLSIHRNESRASHVMPAPPTAPAQPSSDGSGNSKWWSSTFKRRSRRTNVNRVDEPRRPDTELAQSSTGDPNSSSERHISNSQSAPNYTAVSGTSTQPRLKTENLLSTNNPSSQTPTPSPSSPDGGGKKTVISAIKLLLRTAVHALKSVPIPNLDQIPNTLLEWIQIYEVCESLPVAIGNDLLLTFHFNICRGLPAMMQTSKRCST